MDHDGHKRRPQTDLGKPIWRKRCGAITLRADCGFTGKASGYGPGGPYLP